MELRAEQRVSASIVDRSARILTYFRCLLSVRSPAADPEVRSREDRFHRMLKC